jgi:hypothetical protein
MKPTINVVVTCTKRKRLSPKRELQLRSVKGRSLVEKNKLWLLRLKKALGEKTSARDLYAGDHWSVVRALDRAAADSKLSVNIWICSAGYGLVGLDAKLHPYAATFAVGFADSITRGMPKLDPGESAKEWWALLTKWQGPTTGSPRSIAGLAKIDPNSPLLVVASPNYLIALENDLLKAAKSLKGVGRLMIVTSASQRVSQLSEYCLPCSAVLQRVVGGARTSLNVRLARRLLEQIPSDEFNYSTAYKKLKRLIRQQPKCKRKARLKTNDEAVEKFIAKAFGSDQGAGCDALLKDLRASGRACEYSRFRSLFRRIKKEKNAK